MKRKTLFTLSALALTVTLFFACSKHDSSTENGKPHLEVYLTDDPANYDEVVIDVKDVKINYSSDTANGWKSLSQVNVRPYDILKLVNGKDTMIGQTDLDSGRIEQIRLILGPNNYVKVNGQTYTLETPSAQQSGLKINLHQDVSAGLLYKLLLDFDAARSIVKTGNGKYMLKPVIRASLEAQGGSLKGYVLPNTFNTSVFAIQGTDTVAGTITSAGSYSIRGLNAGTYSLAFAPSDTTYKRQSKTGIAVNNGVVTTVDTVRLVH
jgi:major membrane immunogen (membrane-anchored lipoprotein)